MIEKLQRCKSLNDIAKLLGYKPSSLAYLLYYFPENKKYFEFEIPKKTEGTRKILAPEPKLKLLQHRLATVLADCYQETYLDHEKYAQPLAFGFAPGLSIFENANKHKNKKFVLNVDIKDFFTSINFGRVRGFFIKNKYFKLNPKVSTIIAQIACYSNQLPQGSPCSPIISNLIATQLDARLVSLARKSKCTYSRYADDLTFSTNFKEFPNNLAIEQNENNSNKLGNDLVSIIENSGFHVNLRKVSLQFKRSRQVATGLVVNKKVNVANEYYRQARSMCNVLFKTDSYYFDNEKNNPTINKLLGMINFIYWIKIGWECSKKNTNVKNNQKNDTGIVKLYKKLILYKYFVNPSKLVILTEGKTDKIYLKYALQSLCLKNKYPELIKKISDKPEKFEYAFSFVNIRNTIIHDLFKIPSGTSGLVKLSDRLMKSYDEEIYTSPLSFKKTVVIVCDNDDSGKEVFNKVSKKQKNVIKILDILKIFCLLSKYPRTQTV